MFERLRSHFPRWAGLALLLGALASPLHAQQLTVLADSSLAPALETLAREFQAGHQGVSLKLQFGASGALLEQMAKTPGTADVLLSTGEETAALGVQRRLLVADLRSGFAANTLVLVVPASQSLPVQRLSDLARPEVARIAMGREVSVPAGRLAREAINAQRLWPSVQRKVVLAEDVREVLALVAGGDVEAGFVLGTDAAAAGERIRVVERLATTTPIRHLASVAAGSKHPALAQAFVAYLRGDTARATLEKLGYGAP